MVVDEDLDKERVWAMVAWEYNQRMSSTCTTNVHEDRVRVHRSTTSVVRALR